MAAINATVDQAVQDGKLTQAQGDAKTKLDSAVTDKTLAQAQADSIYQKLTTSMDGMLNNTQPNKGGPGFFNHPGPRGNPNQNQAAGS